VLALAFANALPARSQTVADTGQSDSTATTGDGRILLVLPFDNRSGQPSLEWVREAAPEILSTRLASAGFAPMSRADRLYALDHLGLPQGFHPSRATALKLAQTLDADSIVVGSFVTDGAGILAQAQIVDVPHLRMSQAVTARGDLQNLIAVFDSLAWKLTRELDPAFTGSEETFVASGAGLHLDAFQEYVRGITEPDQAERLRHLQQAVSLNPDYSDAWMALGREDYSSQQYDAAAVAFSKVNPSGPDSLEAGFYRGLSLLFSGDYRNAEAAFGNVARVLPLAPVVNNQGVAVSRQGRDGIVLFRQAEAADPNAADYHFNLAVSLQRHGNVPDALAELAQCLRLRPNDEEAQELNDEWRASAKPQKVDPPPADQASPASASQPKAIPGPAPKADPLERIARTFDAAAFRQAALMMDQVDAARQAALSPAERAQELAAQAQDYLGRGLLLEAERLSQAAVAADAKSSRAHLVLALVRERTGDIQGAHKEAQAALNLARSSDAYLVLGRLDLATGNLDNAGKEAAEALKLQPSNASAQELQRQIESRQSTK
jgi:tetratricopeptide (TPR) repeat protein